MDLLFLMVKRKQYFLNPISRQNFANAFAETPNLNLEVRHIYMISTICDWRRDCRTVWCPVCTRNFPVVWCGRGLGIGLDSSSSIAGYRLCNYDCQVIKGYINHKPWDHFMCIIWYDPIQYTIPMHIGTPFITMIIVIWQWDMTQSNPQFQYMSTPPLWSFRQCTVRYDPIQYPIPIHGYTTPMIV